MKEIKKIKIRIKKDLPPLRKDQVIETSEFNARDLVELNLAELVDE